jgi:co-chaperonin GroES (HSP10)
MDVKVGDKVLYAQATPAQPSRLDGKEFLILKENDVLAVVE